VASVLSRADQAFARARPRLVAGKYARMAARSYDFYRGSLPLFLADARDPRSGLGVSRFAVDGPLPLALGDAHPENFGVLEGLDGALALEPNDFDAADRWPWHWDLRRMLTGILVGAREARAGDPESLAAWQAAEPAVVTACARSYAEAIAAYAGGLALAPLTEAAGEPILEDLFGRATRDLAARAELAALTELDAGGARRLRRGQLAADDPQSMLAPLPPYAVARLAETLAVYRETLLELPPASELQVLDAARVFGSGVASWPRVRVLILVAGPTEAPEDDVILELKELSDSGARAWFPPGLLARDVGGRVLSAARLAWARPDAEPRWGVSSWLGLPVQLRREAEGHKNVRVARWVGPRGTVEAVTGAGVALARLLARVHARPVDGVSAAGAIARAIARDPEGFIAEQAAVCASYADSVEADHRHFLAALRALGPTLGVEARPEDAPHPDLAAVLGDPPPVPPLEP
jgi:uncharacterized protein (DUF2252 family)